MASLSYKGDDYIYILSCDTHEGNLVFIKAGSGNDECGAYSRINPLRYKCNHADYVEMNSSKGDKLWADTFYDTLKSGNTFDRSAECKCEFLGVVALNDFKFEDFNITSRLGLKIKNTRAMVKYMLEVCKTYDEALPPLIKSSTKK